MPKFLKTEFPCKRCGVSTKVRSFSEGEHARCPKCSELARRVSLVRWADEAAERERLKVHEKTEDPRVLSIGGLKAMEETVKAAFRCMEAVELLPPAEQRHYIRCAHARLRRALNLGGKLLPFIEQAREESAHGLTAVDGGRPPEDAPEVPARSSHLRLVRPGDER